MSGLTRAGGSRVAGGIAGFLSLGLGNLVAANLTSIGVSPLRMQDPTLLGSNVPVAQVEGGAPTWQVNPSAVGKTAELLTWIASSGSASNFPNALGSESDHANAVAGDLFGGNGIAPGVSHVWNYEAAHFYAAVVGPRASITPAIVNQSFVFSPPYAQAAVDQAYDNYAAQRNTLFISGIGNGGAVNFPATCYNGIGVGAWGGVTSFGPTLDNGRCKPDISAPAPFTSFSTPQVAGVAAVILQAAARGDAGPDTSVLATNATAIKALLLNGAVKSVFWTNSPTAPLDHRYGAGVVNLYNSYLQLRAGRHAMIESTSPLLVEGHLSGTNTQTLSVLRGWDVNTASSTVITHGVNHYYLTLPGAMADRFAGAVTLVWNRRFNQAQPNNLDLFLVRADDGTPVAQSISSVDNVEHLFLHELPPGRYDLQVFKHGGPTGRVSNNETYALAFDFTPARLAINAGANGVAVTWPASGAGFFLQSAADFQGAPWQDVTNALVVTNGHFHLQIPALNRQYYRLLWP